MKNEENDEQEESKTIEEDLETPAFIRKKLKVS